MTSAFTDDVETPAGVAPSRHRTPAERQAIGLDARRILPPGDQAELVLPHDRPDPVATAQHVALTRVPDLVPLRHSRMAASAFAYLRGNALGMAVDLAAGPVSGLTTQLCGDAHLSNFGLFGSAERRLLFDINDFDETFAGPWEWDLKRLATSIVVAGRQNGFSDKECRATTREAVRRYRDAMAEFAGMGTLDVWYAHLDVDELTRLAGERLDKESLKRLGKAVRKARSSGQLKALEKLTTSEGGTLRFRADPPTLVPLAELVSDVQRSEVERHLPGLLERYRRTLPPDRRVLLDKFELVDVAHKVVGVGSVGTRCWVLLLRGRDDGDPLFLQIKQAQPSVLAGRVPAMASRTRPVRNQGARVVSGQRLMQAASDIFLGWNHMRGFDGVDRDFYVRQLRDMKFSAAVETMPPATMERYAGLCGWTLARAHARTGDPVAISAYIGDDDVFPKAIGKFAERYAARNEQDHADFAAGIADGRLPTAPEGS